MPLLVSITETKKSDLSIIVILSYDCIYHSVALLYAQQAKISQLDYIFFEKISFD